MSANVPEKCLETGVIAVLADCHIHPGGGPEFPARVLEALAGVDLIVTLGDMGDSAGLDQLAAIAPVIGVRGADDADDPRTSMAVRTFQAGHYTFGCVFDATAAGLATSSDPFVPAPDILARCEQLFGLQPEFLLHASTHKPGSGEFGRKGKALNPGSAVLPAEGAQATFAKLFIYSDRFDTHMITVD